MAHFTLLLDNKEMHFLLQKHSRKPFMHFKIPFEIKSNENLHRKISGKFNFTVCSYQWF